MTKEELLIGMGFKHTYENRWDKLWDANDLDKGICVYLADPVYDYEEDEGFVYDIGGNVISGMSLLDVVQYMLDRG